jgi:hypothetical protein
LIKEVRRHIAEEVTIEIQRMVEVNQAKRIEISVPCTGTSIS